MMKVNRRSLLLAGLALLCCSWATPASAARPSLSGSSCAEACLFSWRIVDDVLRDPVVQNNVVSFAESTCAEIGGGDKCQNLAEGLLPVVLQWLSSPATAQQFCASTCPAHLALTTKALTEDEEKARQSVGDPSCAMCTLVVSQVQQILNNSAVFDKINETAQAACAQLPADMAASCSAFVNKYEPLLEALIEKASPEELCEILGVCSVKLVQRLNKAQLPALDTAQRKRMPCTYKLVRSVQMARLSTAPGMPQGALGDSCDMCKMAVIEAHSLITNPSVQQSIVNYTASLCAQFQSFNDTCVLYVQTYAPVVFSLLEQYLVPDSLCVNIGICPAKPPAVAASKLTEADGRGLGYEVVSAVVSWVDQLRAALGTRVAADHLVTMEMANAAANAWSASATAGQEGTSTAAAK